MAGNGDEPLLAQSSSERMSKRLGAVNVHKGFLTDPHVWYRHPLVRIFILFLVLFMDFFTYGEDPGQDSHIWATSTGVGQIVGLMAFDYAPCWQMSVLKIFLLLVTFILSWQIGKGLRAIIVWCGVPAFKADGGLLVSGALMMELSAFLVDAFYNYILTLYFINDPWYQRYHIDSHSLELFTALFFLPSRRAIDIGKMWQWISSTLDWLAIFQIIDSVFQDDKYYPKFATGCKKRYKTSTCGGYEVRNLFFFAGFPIMSALTGYLLSFTGNQPGQINWQIKCIGGSTEVVRTALGAIIVFLDLFCFVQDWEFPLFSEDHHDEQDRAKIAGSDSNEVKILGLRFTAKWLQYGPLLGTMGADFAFVKSMFTYSPDAYGEYVDPFDQTLWVVTNTTLLDSVYPLGSNNDPETLKAIEFWARHTCDDNTEQSTCELRPGCETDVHTTSRYLDTHWDQVCAVIAACILVGFFAVLKYSMSEALREEMDAWGEEEWAALDVAGAGSAEANGHYELVRDPKKPSGIYRNGTSNATIEHDNCKSRAMRYWHLKGVAGNSLYVCMSANRICPLNEGQNPYGWKVDDGKDDVPTISQAEALQPLLPFGENRWLHPL